MKDLLYEINNIHTNISILNADIEYLANCYINNVTNFELPVSDEDVIIHLSYKRLEELLTQKINQLRSTTHIDSVTLTSYIDYYYQFIK
jgi:hypothetical protein